MPSAFWVVTPASADATSIAIAAARAGELGILDFAWHAIGPAQLEAAALLKRRAPGDHWGLRVESVDDSHDLAALRPLALTEKIPLLIIAGVDMSSSADALLAHLRTEAGQLAQVVYLEIYRAADAEAAQRAGFDGVVLKGNEAAGRVSQESSFLLLQQLHGRLTIPMVIQGGIGLDTAAAAFLAGAAGVVLREQVWLTRESPFDDADRQRWAALDGSETVTVSDGACTYRFLGRADRATVARLDRLIAEGTSCAAAVAAVLRRSEDAERGPDDELTPLGQEIAFASDLASRFGTVGALLRAMRRRTAANLRMAREQQALGPGAPLAQDHGLQYPILQGPMTRVSDVAPFCHAVARDGALPFLALALLRAPEVRQLLTQTRERMGQLSWGVGILGFVPAELRKEQSDVIRDICPPYAIIAGGRPSQARQFEKLGICTYLHVPSPGLLESFVADGARKFIFEGRECGGHVGPRSSFTLWQSAIDVLLQTEISKPEELHIIFAGGIHDALSAAMVATLAAPLVARGMKIGVLMGTAYLFTQEGVTCGAITAEFQRQALDCRETILLESGIGHATRCVPSPFAHEFVAARHEMLRDGKSSDEIRMQLEMFNIGRLRLAAKGVDRRSSADSGGKGELYQVDEATQRDKGMFMIGQVAALRDRVLTTAELHADVSAGGVTCLQNLATPELCESFDEPAVKRHGEDIAIVGMGCMFPQSRNLREYWQNILRGFNALREVPADRWQADDFYSTDRSAPDRINSKWGAFIEDIIFDPLKYHIPPASLASIEPIQLLALEVALEALEDAGYRGDDFGGERTSVIFGVSSMHDRGAAYAFRTMIRQFLPQVDWMTVDAQERLIDSLEQILPAWTEDSFAGYLGNVIAGRISNRLNLRGSNFVVDAACAASLAALHAAVLELRSHTCDVVVAGAADGTNNPFTFMSFAKTHALTSSGQPRPFDDSADGIALGEGVAALVLKRLSDAERDGDQIYAVIKGVGSSSDGRNRSLTAPHPHGQVTALERAYDDAGVEPSTVTLVEAHGTGTAVGDRTEITSLQTMYKAHGSARQSCAIGSVKSMIGHTKTAAGMASLIKTALALKHRILPPTIGVTTPNRQIDFAHSPFYINTEARPWVDRNGASARRAGLSSFGFGGTNFHVVLEEYTGEYHSRYEFDLAPRDAELFVWRRRESAQILAEIDKLQRELADVPMLDLARLGRAVAVDEAARPTADGECCRLAIVATSLDDLRAKLHEAASKVGQVERLTQPSGIYYSTAEPLSAAAVCFLFPGQGSQSVNMLRDLALGNPDLLYVFERADAVLDGVLPQPLSRYIFPLPTFDETTRPRQASELNDTRVAQPALGAVDLFGAKLLQRFGLKPAIVAGHSYGEYVALCVSGAMSEDDLMRLSAARGRIAHDATETCPGAMAAVMASGETTSRELEKLGSNVHLANLNGPEQTTFAGPVADVDAAVAKLNAAGLRAKKIPVTAPFHTPLMATAASQLADYLHGVDLRPPQVAVSSNTTAGRYPNEPALMRDLLTRHLTHPVQFERQIRDIYDGGVRLFLEVGPGSVLTNLVGRILRDKPHTALALDAAGRSGWLQLAHVLAQCSALGLPIDVEAWFSHRRLPRLGVSKLCAKTRQEQQRKPTDWIVNAGQSRPFAAPPKALPSGKPSAPATKTSGAGSNVESESRSTASNHAATSAPSNAAAIPLPQDITGSSPPIPSSIHQESSMSMHPSNGEPSDGQYSAHNASTHANSANSAAANHSTSAVALPALTSPTTVQQGPASVQALAYFQTTMSAWLELQKSQNDLSHRFLRTQEKVLLAFLQGGSAQQHTVVDAVTPKLTVAPSRPAAPSLRVAPAGASAGRPAPSPVVPVGPRPPVMASAMGHGLVAPPTPATAPKTPTFATNGNGEHASAPKAAAPSNGAPSNGAPSNGAPSNGAPSNGAPSNAAQPPGTDQFRQDLLESVSQRTGYPTEMLNEDLPLEAGLGIDSIKTLEVFNALKQYHPFFRDDDEQEQDDVLAEFAQLKTLGKIIEAYDMKRQRFLTGGSNGAAAPAPRKAVAAPVHEPAGQVERFEVAAVPAPLSATSPEKKNSLNGTSS